MQEPPFNPIRKREELTAKRNLPVNVYVSDGIKSMPDATMKGQELKLTIKAER